MKVPTNLYTWSLWGVKHLSPHSNKTFKTTVIQSYSHTNTRSWYYRWF